ncbi:TonB-dependent receptor plug domain-containing protein, partial [Bacteroidota bacterium]
TSIRYELNHSLEVQPGLRISYNSVYKTPLLPSLNVKWRIIDRLNFRSSVAKGYRAPTIKELYINFKDINHNIVPNTDLKPEEGINITASLDYNTEREEKLHYSHVKLNSFYNNIKNNINLALVERFATLTDEYKYVNLTYFKTIGMNAQFSYEFYQKLYFSAGYGKTGIYFSTEVENSSIHDYIFSDNVSMSLSLRPINNNLNFSFFYKYNGKLIFYGINEFDEIRTGEMQPFHILDFTVLKRFVNKYSITTGIKDIFNVTDVRRTGDFIGFHTSTNNSSMAGWGRTIFLKLAMDIKWY